MKTIKCKVLKKYKWYRKLLGGIWFKYQDDITKEIFWYHNIPTETDTKSLIIENYEKATHKDL